MGENKEKENEPTGQGGPNPWIYDVSKAYPGQQYPQQQPDFWSDQHFGASGLSSPPPRQTRRRGMLMLWITLIVLVLLIAVSILILILIVR